MTKKHQGKIIQSVIKKSGVPITKIIEKIKKDYGGLRCSRTKLYYLFKQEEVDSKFILALGSIIYHDFSVNFPKLGLKKMIEPALEESNLFYFRKNKQLLLIHEKATLKLQKSYIRLLKCMTKIANNNTDTIIKEKINNFLEALE